MTNEEKRELLEWLKSWYVGIVPTDKIYDRPGEDAYNKIKWLIEQDRPKATKAWIEEQWRWFAEKSFDVFMGDWLTEVLFKAGVEVEGYKPNVPIYNEEGHSNEKDEPDPQAEAERLEKEGK